MESQCCNNNNNNNNKGAISYRLEIIRQKDANAVIHFLHKFFFIDEPLNVAIKLFQQEDLELRKQTINELETFSIESINEGTSVMAVNNDNNIIGVIINECVDKNAHIYYEAAESERFDKIKKLLWTLDNESNVFSRFPHIHKLLDVKIVSVNDAYRGQGICKNLIEKTRELAMMNDIKLIRVNCSSEFSARAVARLGFQFIYEILYKDYKDEKGHRIFNTQPPHEAAKVYIMPL